VKCYSLLGDIVSVIMRECCLFARYPDVSPDSQVPTQSADSDFETEAELPPLESVISKDVFRKLEKKEKKWHDVVNGKCHITVRCV